MKLLDEYKKSLKMAEAEEYLDLGFYRPIAFAIVKAIYRLPITPNQVTLMALVGGLLSAYYFSIGTAHGFALAAMWYAIANVFDCGDGMLARLQNSGTPLGRLVDGVVDWVSSAAIFTAMGIGLTIYTGDATVWYITVAGALTSAMHAMIFDYYQQEYISNVKGQKNFLESETARIGAEVAALKNEDKKLLRRTVLEVYLRYLAVQQRAQIKEETRMQFPPEMFRAANIRIMRWWTFLGPTTNRTLLMVFALVNQPVMFLWLVFIPGNLYLTFLLIWQRKILRRLERTVKQAVPASPPQTAIRA